jgi:hypothetical protein
LDECASVVLVVDVLACYNFLHSVAVLLACYFLAVVGRFFGITNDIKFKYLNVTPFGNSHMLSPVTELK